jgi:site-specific DNA recombinase
VSKLSAELIERGILSKQRVSRRGPVSGGVAYSRSALYALLKNRLYLGEIAYRGQIYRGEYEPIIDRGLWERVQQQLNGWRKARHEGVRARSPSLLLGRVYDQSGRRYTPSHSVKNAKRYRYYVIPSARRQQASVMAPARIPAHDLETLVVQRLLRWLSDKLAMLDALSSPGDDTALAQALLGAATAHCRAWPTLSAEEVRGVVRAVVVKITIGSTASPFN